MIGKKTKPAKSPIDRRVARTRAMLQQALISLILEKGYEAITIKDICEAANIGRSTFYAHYKSKEDLKRRGLEENLRRLFAERQKAALAAPENDRGRGFIFSLIVFEHARDHIALYRAMAKSQGGVAALDVIRQMLSELVNKELSESAGMHIVGEVPRELVVQYIVGAYMAMLTWWLDRGARLSPQRMDKIFLHLVARGLKLH